MEVLTKKNILLNVAVKDKREAIQLAGDILVQGGYVEPEYIIAMFERESSVSTYMGNHIAIPHGTSESKKFVKHPGISLLQIPAGVNYGGDHNVKLVFGIAGKNNDHMKILTKIALVCADESKVKKIVQAQTKDEILSIFEEGGF